MIRYILRISYCMKVFFHTFAGLLLPRPPIVENQGTGDAPARHAGSGDSDVEPKLCKRAQLLSIHFSDLL